MQFSKPFPLWVVQGASYMGAVTAVIRITGKKENFLMLMNYWIFYDIEVTCRVLAKMQQFCKY